MLKRLALACAALFAVALAYVPTEASAHGWRVRHYGWHCHRCYRPVRWHCHRCYRPVRVVRRVIPICYGKYCADRGAGVVRPVIVATYPTWGWWGYRHGWGWWGYRHGWRW